MSFESNLKKILELKGMKQTELLIKVLEKCGEKKPYEKINLEKSNFNNMIKGNRSFKADYILAIEEILGIRFIDLYKDEPVKRYYELKGIRYAASIDEIDEYKKIFNEGEEVFLNRDEYGKNIIDYICEYNSKNGLKFLIDDLKMKYDRNRLTVSFNGKQSSFYDNSILGIVKMICSNDETDYFNKLFPANYYLGYRYLYGFVYDSDDFYKSILSSDEIIKELLKLYEVSFKELNPNKETNKNDRYYAYHPILFKVIEYALKHDKKYYNQIKMIIEIGIERNNIIISDLRKIHNYKYSIEEYEIKNGFSTYGYILYIDLSKYESLDDELKIMIGKLNQNAKKVEIKPSSKDIEFEEHLEPKEFFDMIYKTSGLDNYLSDYIFIFHEIKRTFVEVNCKIDKLGDSLLEYLIGKKEDLKKRGVILDHDYRTITFAISFAELYKDKLNNL